MLTGNLKILQSYTGERTFTAIADFNRKVLQGICSPGEWFFFDTMPGMKAIPLIRSNADDSVKEFHRQYTDVHILLSGSDLFCLAGPISEVVEPYRSEGDYSLVKADTLQEIILTEGQFILVEPGEVHCNILTAGSIKTVIKLIHPWPKL